MRAHYFKTEPCIMSDRNMHLGWADSYINSIRTQIDPSGARFCQPTVCRPFPTHFGRARNWDSETMEFRGREVEDCSQPLQYFLCLPSRWFLPIRNSGTCNGNLFKVLAQGFLQGPTCMWEKIAWALRTLSVQIGSLLFELCAFRVRSPSPHPCPRRWWRRFRSSSPPKQKLFWPSNGHPKARAHASATWLSSCC